MSGQNQTNIAKDSRRIYERIKESIEALHANQFVATKPTSGEHLLGATLSEPIAASHGEHPDRPAHASRVDHKAVIHFGLHVR